METSGVLRRRFQALGFETYSIDLLPSKDGGEATAYSADRRPLGRHLIGDVFDHLDNMAANDLWPTLGIFHPDCTMHTLAGQWAFGDGPYHQKVRSGTLVGRERRERRERNEQDVRRIVKLKIRHKAIENPRGTLVSRGVLPPETQVIHPNQFGDDASKTTCLWLWGLPKLKPTGYVEPRVGGLPLFGGDGGLPRWGNQTDSGQNRLSPSDDRWDKRSETFPGIGDAMAAQWGAFLRERYGPA